ncbi:MAG TPA: hypothetical protein VIS96_17980 [Terrimicrobiaceae bacterium]
MEKQRNTIDATPTSTAPAGSVRVEYTLKGEEKVIEKDYELLVVACDPRNLYGICDYTTTERGIFDKLKNFTFHTSLPKVNVPKLAQKHAVIFAPNPLEAMAGNVYGFRNESAKQFGLDRANEMRHNLVTVYQLVGPTDTPWSDNKFREILHYELKQYPWWPFSDDYEILDTVTTPYFNHFSYEDLEHQLPWTLLNIQGQNHSLYVHASTCFESVLHCYAAGATHGFSKGIRLENVSCFPGRP